MDTPFSKEGFEMSQDSMGNPIPKIITPQCISSIADSVLAEDEKDSQPLFW